VSFKKTLNNNLALRREWLVVINFDKSKKKEKEKELTTPEAKITLRKEMNV